MRKENILGIDVSITSYEKLKKDIDRDIKTKKQSSILAINPEKILKARKDNELRKLLNAATYQIPDGIGVVLASKLKKGEIKKRVTGFETMNMLCELANEKGYTIFLYGSKKGVANSAKEALERKYSKINIVGTMDGYEKDNKKIVDVINKSKADIIFVALGSPKQEHWIKENMKKTCPKIFQGAGGSIDVFSGNVKRAPKWMQNCGLEWLHRLIKEPKRIFRQIKLVKFVMLVIFSRCKEYKNED